MKEAEYQKRLKMPKRQMKTFGGNWIKDHNNYRGKFRN
jgi:hypothetical protein